MSLEAVCVKEEPVWEERVQGVSEAAARAGLYVKHEVLDDLVIGPEVMQPPDSVFAIHAGLDTKTNATEDVKPFSIQQLLACCHVKLERLNTQQNTCNTHPASHKEPKLIPSENCSNLDQDIIHAISVLKSEEFNCDICGKGFGKWKGNLKRHIKFHLRNGIRNRGDFVASLNRKPEKAHCNICKKTFASKIVLRNHKQLHKGDRRFTYNLSKPVCDKCGKSFLSKCYLIKHIETHLRREAREREAMDASVPKYYCKFCKRIFTCETKLSAHERTHTERPHCCDMCDKRYASKSVLRRHRKVHARETKYCCKICKKLFSEKHNLTRHELTHTGQKAFSCDCGEKFAQKAYLVSHIRAHHTGKKLYECTICDVRYARNSTLQCHNQLRHSNEKPFACDFCEKRFKLKYYLMCHRVIHTGQRPYACKICGKRFSQPHHLTIHKRLHTGKPFACGTCKKKFAENSKLTNHMLVHSGLRFVCDVCKKEFIHKDFLKSHMKIHSELRPHACNICQKSFRIKAILAAHKLVHTGEKPFACKRCPKRFKCKQNLKRHEATHYKRSSCDICGSKFTKKYLSVHKRRCHTDDHENVKESTKATRVLPSRAKRQ